MLMIFYKHIIEEFEAFAMLFYSKVSTYKGYLPTLFEVLIQTENILFLNTGSIYQWNTDTIVI